MRSCRSEHTTKASCCRTRTRTSRRWRTIGKPRSRHRTWWPCSCRRQPTPCTKPGSCWWSRSSTEIPQCRARCGRTTETCSCCSSGSPSHQLGWRHSLSWSGLHENYRFSQQKHKCQQRTLTGKHVGIARSHTSVSSGLNGSAHSRVHRAKHSHKQFRSTSTSI
jgi:hypothetical protein